MNTASKEAVREAIKSQHKKVRTAEKDLTTYSNAGRRSLMQGQTESVNRERESLDNLIKTLPKAEQDEIRDELGLNQEQEQPEEEVPVGGQVSEEPENSTGEGTKPQKDPKASNDPLLPLREDGGSSKSDDSSKTGAKLDGDGAQDEGQPPVEPIEIKEDSPNKIVFDSPQAEAEVTGEPASEKKSTKAASTDTAKNK